MSSVNGRGPQLNEPAPYFEAESTQGPRKLSDYRGKWLVLFSHPADFTPVCTSEFISFARRYSDFQASNCELLGLSVDSTFSHLAWVRNIEERFDIRVPFPILSDVSMKVACSFGMIHPGCDTTSTVRALFIIDPEGILRAMIYYPMTNGRSIDEVLRLLQGLQTSDLYGVATPEGWHPGDSVIVPAPRTAEAAEQRLKEGLECVDWYFCKKKLPVKTKKTA